MARTELFRSFNSSKFVGTSLTTLIDIPTALLEAIFITILNVGTSNFDAFEIHGKPNGSGDFVTLRSTAGQFTTPQGILIEASGDLTILASGVKGWLILYPKGISTIRLLASRASGIDTVTINVGGS